MTLDADGNVLTVSVSEPRFTALEVETLLAARRLEFSRNDLGIPHDVAMDPANQGRFNVIGPRRDWSEDAVNQKKADYRRRYPDADMSSLRWSVELIDG